MSKLLIVGLEGSSGIGGKSGKAYDIGNVHTLIDLADPFGVGNVARGQMGTTYQCTSELVKSVQHLPLPFEAECDVKAIMKFGKREENIVSIVPLKMAKPAGN